MTTVDTGLQLSQQERALIRANHVRLGRAELKRQVKRKDVDLRTLITEPPEVMETATVFDVLQWLPRVGPERARRILFGVCGLTLTLGNTGGHTRARICQNIGVLYSGQR